MFEKELQYFINNQDGLVKKHSGKTLVLKGESVVGVYDSPLDAYLDAEKKYGRGSYMIQPCVEGADAYTVTISTHELFEPAG